MKKADLVLVPLVSLTKDLDAAVLHGTEPVVELARNYGVPVYSVASSMHIIDKEVHEDLVAHTASDHGYDLKFDLPKYDHISIDNMSGVISETGIFNPKAFIKEAEVARDRLVNSLTSKFRE